MGLGRAGRRFRANALINGVSEVCQGAKRRGELFCENSFSALPMPKDGTHNSLQSQYLQELRGLLPFDRQDVPGLQGALGQEGVRLAEGTDRNAKGVGDRV